MANEGEAWDLFASVVFLSIDDDTLRTRFATRRADEFGGRPDEHDPVLGWHTHVERSYRETGVTIIDATLPLEDVAAAILAATREPERP